MKSGIREVTLNAAIEMMPSSRQERMLESTARSLLARTRLAAAKFPETRGVFLGGSYAKGTWLPQHVDLDVFVRIDPDTPEEEFEKIGLAVGKTATKGFPQGKKYAQHPYTEALVGGIRVNIVPCYAVEKGDWKSAADRSLFHAKIVSSLRESDKTQIRLLKMFMIAAGVYGAEIEVRGFSGYVAEVLVMEHGGLKETLRYFATMKLRADGYPFHLHDPVDEGRDLGIAVSGEKLGRMILASREFLNNPSGAYFVKMRGFEHSELRKRVVAVVFSHPVMSEDTLWGELRRAARQMVRHLELHGFTVARCMAASDNTRSSAILIIPEYDTLPAFEQRIGPAVDRRKDLKAFISANRQRAELVWVDDDARARILRPRKHTKLTDFLQDTLKGKVGQSVSSHELDRGLKRSGSVISGARLEQKAKTSKWLDIGIKEIVSDAFGIRQD